jgi:hypothetical protein
MPYNYQVASGKALLKYYMPGSETLQKLIMVKRRAPFYGVLRH